MAGHLLAWTHEIICLTIFRLLRPS